MPKVPYRIDPRRSIMSKVWILCGVWSMSLLEGNVTVSRFKLDEKITVDLIEALEKGAFKKKKLGPQESNVGFAVAGNELSTCFSKLTVEYGNKRLFSVRKEKMAIPAKEIDLLLKQRINERKDATGEQFIPSKQLKEMKENVIDCLVCEQYQVSTIAQVMIVDDEVYVDTTSTEMIDEVDKSLIMHMKVNMKQQDFLTTALSLTESKDDILDSIGLGIVDIEEHPEFLDDPHSKFGGAFLTWLYYSYDFFTSPSLMFEDPITLTGEAVGSKQVQLSKGTVNNCSEMAIALKIGKTISKAKMTMLQDDASEQPPMWYFTVDKDTASISGCKLPKVTEKDEFGRIFRRLEYVMYPHAILDNCIKHFIDTRYNGEKWDEVKIEMIEWLTGL